MPSKTTGSEADRRVISTGPRGAATAPVRTSYASRPPFSITLSELGYVPDSRANAVLFVKRALDACRNKKRAVLVFPRGRYDFWPQYCEEKLYYESNSDLIPLRRCPILLEDLKNIEIDGKGSEFIFHDRMQPVTVDKCTNVVIRNVTIDWDVPLSTHAEIIAVTGRYIDIAINVLESPYVLEKNKIVFVGEGWKSELWDVMEFEKETKRIPQQTGDEPCLGEGFKNYKATEICYGIVRLNYAFKRKPSVGNYLVLRHSARDHAGIFIIDSKNVTIENTNMFQNAGLGILSQYSETLTFRGVNRIPNPAKNRVLAGHDDGFHYSSCRGKIIIDNCKFVGLMDDPVNVHGTSVQIVEKISARKLVCKFMHDQSIGFTWARPGERVGFIENEAMDTRGIGIVKSFSPQNPRLFEITFKDPIPEGIEVGDALENLTWVPDVSITKSFFGSCRARGLLISTPGKVIIENNIFESSGSAILIPGDANYWFESGAVKDVVIRKNTFGDQCLTSMYQFCEGIISICPEIPRSDPRKTFHRNIRIEHNTFNPFDFPVLYAKSTQRLWFNKNTIRRSRRFKPFHKRKFMITLEGCKKVTVSGNSLEGAVLGKNVKLIAMSPADVQLDPGQDMVIA